jgi:hypothetical protein
MRWMETCAVGEGTDPERTVSVFPICFQVVASGRSGFCFGETTADSPRQKPAARSYPRGRRRAIAVPAEMLVGAFGDNKQNRHAKLDGRPAYDPI